ncbi:MAG: hypothetical protein CSA39_03905 [Flavobacteriales bacterium]|nr:MAG: hypothetical protein CR985_03965 [Flavobacteriales bacterium]PIE49176.1 MAG: hypothetical protein CSA39_03905 [Flavobacteriales bacterium]
MTLEKIVAVIGKPGLYQIISQAQNRLIVESLQDKKRLPVQDMHKITALNDIAIYTYTEEKPLREIFKDMAKKHDGKVAINHKESDEKLTAYFLEILPDFDQDRVYASNIKKVVQWYNILAEINFDFSTIKIDSDEEE